jgi:hypothetical protein
MERGSSGFMVGIGSGIGLGKTLGVLLISW